MRNRLTVMTRAVSPPLKNRGLTLIELLVAISVLAFIAVLGWRGLDSIVRSRLALTGDLEQTRGMQLAFAQLQSDCSHLASTAVLPDKMPIFVEQGRLMLVRTVFADNQPSRLQIITYRVKDGTLTRRESAATRDLAELDTLWRAAANDIDATQPVVLQSDVAALKMRLWSGGSWHESTDTQTPTVPADLNVFSIVPTGLEVALQLRGREGNLLKIFLLGAV